MEERSELGIGWNLWARAKILARNRGEAGENSLQPDGLDSPKRIGKVHVGNITTFFLFNGLTQKCC